MNRMLIFVVVIILIAVATVVILNKNTTANSASITVTDSASPSPKKTSSPALTQAASASATISPSTSPSPSVAVNLKATKAVIKTSKGDIELQLYPDDAPNTVANFVKKSQSNFYNNLTFHRVEDWVIQGGDPLGNGTGGGNMPTELNKKPFVVGSLGVARGQDIKISNDAQFFITKKDSSFLNGQYTNFGIVTKGMDIVNNIAIGDKILGVTTE